jgi:hypothetical protein
MSFEFVHTSIEKGVRGGSGFAIAVVTRGIPAYLESMLAELSAYDFDRNRAVGVDPIDWAHRILSVQGKSYTVLSRVAPCGSDWSGRANRVAHHLVVEASERAAAGPAWMLSRFNAFCETVPAVEERAKGPVLPNGGEQPRPATGWEAAGFDKGWAGVVAQALLDAPNGTCCVVLPDELDALPLVSDVLALLPPEKRWLLTFSTRFQRLPAGARCQLRFLRAGATGVRGMLAEPGVRAIEVARGVSAGDSTAAVAAREGRMIEPTARPAVSTRVNPVLAPKPLVEREPFEVRAPSLRGGYEAVAEREAAVAPPVAAPTSTFAPMVTPMEMPTLGSPTASGVQSFSPPSKTRQTPMIEYLLFAYAAVALTVALVLFFV